MSDSQTKLNQEVESEIEGLIDARIEDRVSEEVDQAVEDRIGELRDEIADLVEDEIEGIRETVAGFTDRFLTQSEGKTLAQESSLGAIRHIIGEDCSEDSHEALRDDLRGIVREEAQSFELEQEGSQTDEEQDVRDESDPDVWGQHSD